LRAFVEPEILDGSNQYFCEKCACKCDAHKVGLIQQECIMLSGTVSLLVSVNIFSVTVVHWLFPTGF